MNEKNLGRVTVGGLALATQAIPSPLSKASVSQLIFGRPFLSSRSTTKSALSASITTTTKRPTCKQIEYDMSLNLSDIF